MTSFASVFVTLLVDDTIEIKVEPALLSGQLPSGARGQNVNKVESGATEAGISSPTRTQARRKKKSSSRTQKTRDQPKNKENALRQLRLSFMPRNPSNRMAEQQKAGKKKKIEWAHKSAATCSTTAA